MRCPFTYSNGRKCKGYVKTIKLIKVNVEIDLSEDGKIIDISLERSDYHVHLYCSEKGNHAGYGRRDSEQMKCWWSPSLEELWGQINKMVKGVVKVTSL